MNALKRIWLFYRDGFRNMTLGRTLWAVIIIKLLIIFLVLKLFFFPDIVKKKSSEQKVEKSEYVSNELIQRSAE